MFRKVQLRFFGIITSILLAIFIAVLSSINILMDTVMERQTKVVLEQVASGVEYDSNTATFTFQRMDDDKRRREDDPNREEPPPKPDESGTESSQVTTAEPISGSTSSETTAADSSAQPPSTDVQPSRPGAQEQQPTQGPTERSEPTAPSTTPAQQPTQGATERPVQTAPPQTAPIEEPPPPTRGWEEQPPSEPRWDPWGGGHGRRDWEEWDGGFMQTANLGDIPILDGFTIVDVAEPTGPAPENIPSDAFPGGKEPVPKSLGSIDFFVIMADQDGNYLATLNNDDMTEAVAQQYITEILNQKATSGMADNYQFCTEKKSNGTLMVFTDKSAEMDMMKKLKRITVLVGTISVVILSAAAYFLSGLIVRPIKEAFNKQKQFISDASHELKTPLTVISTNADVLAGEIGANKWLTYIQDQTDRMNILVNDLLNLTRLENNTTDFIQTEFDLSKAITNTALPFECQAFENNKNFVLNIEDGIKVVGSEQHIKQMAAIFIDNALKYSKEGGTVRVSLTIENGKPVFSVYNTGKGVRESEKDKIFERFYRSDASRNRSTGGYGLGLAIAKSIIDKHKFKVNVENDEGKSICFVVTMG